MEGRVPLGRLGLTTPGGDSLAVHWTQECGNDRLVLDAAANVVPEPAIIALLLLGIAGAWRRAARPG